MSDFNFRSVHEAVVKHKTDNGPKRIFKEGSISPSGMTKCLRAGFFNATLGEKFDVNTLIIFDHGNIVHNDFVAPILQYWINIVANKPKATIYNEYRLFKDVGDGDYISAFVDNLYYELTDDGDYWHPIEIKSINPRAYRKLKTPKHANLIQTIIYMWCFGAKHGSIVYINKETLESKTFVIYSDEDEFKAIPQSKLYRKLYINVEEVASLYISKRKCGNKFKRENRVPPAEYRISRNSDLYKEIVELGVVMSDKEEYAEKNKGYKCTDNYPSGNAVCPFRAECMAFGLGIEDK